MKQKWLVAVVALVLITCMALCCACSPRDDYEQEYKLDGGTKAIIILPGLLASGMYDSETQEPIWDPFTTDDVDVLEFVGAYDEEHTDITINSIIKQDLSLLLTLMGQIGHHEEGNILQRIMCDVNGDPLWPTTVGVDYDSYDGHIRYGALNSYKQLATLLEEQYGDEYDVVVFNYNWTLDTRKASQDLAKMMKERNYTHSVLIGHSMGGLVASGYMAMSAENRARVDKFVSIATPFYGSYMVNNYYEDPYGWKDMIRDMLEGADLTSLLGETLGTIVYNNLSNTLDDIYESYILPLLFNMTSMYNLLPSPELMTTSAAMGDAHYGFEVDGETVSADDLYDWYCTRAWSTVEPTAALDEVADLPTRKAMLDWQAYRDSFYVAKPDDYVCANGVRAEDGKVFVTDLVDTYYIAGVGVMTATCMMVDDDGVTAFYTDRGDGTVPLWSATHGLPMDNEKVYIVEGVEHVPVGCLFAGDSEQRQYLLEILG